MEITKYIESRGARGERACANARPERKKHKTTPARQTTARRAGTMDEKGIGNGRWVM